MRVGRFLVQGVDVWLNNPRRPLEASGTSGMKAAQNGVPNVSVLDGWWDEGYDGRQRLGDRRPRAEPGRGRAGLVRRRGPVPAAREQDLVPTYYERDKDGVPRRWIEVMRRVDGDVAVATSRRRGCSRSTPSACTCRRPASRSLRRRWQPRGHRGRLTVVPPPRISLALALHNHQPVGNFGWVFAEVFEQAYEPMVDALERHPGVRLSLHYTGPLLDWLDRRATRCDRRVCARSSSATRSRSSAAAYYEPVLASLPERDRVGQLAPDGRRAVEDVVRARARRAPGSPSASGSRTCRRRSSPPATTGRSSTTRTSAPRPSRRTDLWGPYTTEDQGRLLRVFGTEQGLRYRIPFRDVDEVIAYLRDHATEDGRPARDDGRRRREVRRLAHDLGALLGRAAAGSSGSSRRSRRTPTG